jgi:hypothetical protein
MTVSIMTLSIMTLSIITLSIMTLSIMPFNTVMLNAYAECRNWAHYAECCYAECHYADCRYAEWRGALKKNYFLNIFVKIEMFLLKFVSYFLRPYIREIFLQSFVARHRIIFYANR